MEALVSSIEFVKSAKNKVYLKIKLVDKNGNFIGSFGNSKINDDINFRKQLFGVMVACDCYDLLKLSTNNPVFLSVYLGYDYYDRINSIINKNGNGLFFNENGKYEVKKYDLTRFSKIENRGIIRSIISQSGVFTIMIETEVFATFYVTGNVYFGFGYPLVCTGAELDERYVNLSANQFRTFIESILKIYKVNDLLLLGGNEKENYPKVKISLNSKGDVVAIGNDKNNYYLLQRSNCYEIVSGNLNFDVINDDELNNFGSIFRRILKKK